MKKLISIVLVVTTLMVAVPSFAGGLPSVSDQRDYLMENYSIEAIADGIKASGLLVSIRENMGRERMIESLEGLDSENLKRLYQCMLYIYVSMLEDNDEGVTDEEITQYEAVLAVVAAMWLES